jgi:hypothetical protein
MEAVLALAAAWALVVIALRSVLRALGSDAERTERRRARFRRGA